MEMAQVAALVERLTDEQLVQEMQSPSGMAPLQIIMQEMQRRAALRGQKPQQVQGFAAGGPVEEARAASIWDIVQSAVPSARMTSGYRTPQRQAELIAQGAPAARNSRHTSGRAVDWVMPGSMPRRDVEASLRSRNLPFEDVIFHPENNSWHVEMPESWEPGQTGGGQPPAAPMSVPSGAAPNQFLSPEAVNAMALNTTDTLLSRLGLADAPVSVGGAYNEIAALMPDATAAFDPALKRLQGEEADTQRANRGRALMEMGLAMMAAPTPNFMSAVAAGGQAGLSARDRIRQDERGLMQAVIQAQLARSQAEQQQARSVLEAAIGVRSDDMRGRLGAVGAAADITRAGVGSQTNAADAAVRMAMQDQQIAASKELAKIEADNRISAIREQVRAQAETDARPERIYASLYEEALKKVGDYVSVPGPDGRPTMRVYTEADAAAAADAGTRAAVAMRQQLRNGAPQQQAPAPVRSAQPRDLSRYLQGD